MRGRRGRGEQWEHPHAVVTDIMTTHACAPSVRAPPPPFLCAGPAAAVAPTSKGCSAPLSCRLCQGGAGGGGVTQDLRGQVGGASSILCAARGGEGGVVGWLSRGHASACGRGGVVCRLGWCSACSQAAWVGAGERVVGPVGCTEDWSVRPPWGQGAVVGDWGGWRGGHRPSSCWGRGAAVACHHLPAAGRRACMRWRRGAVLMRGVVRGKRGSGSAGRTGDSEGSTGGRRRAAGGGGSGSGGGAGGGSGGGRTTRAGDVMLGVVMFLRLLNSSDVEIVVSTRSEILAAIAGALRRGPATMAGGRTHPQRACARTPAVAGRRACC
jgi:hypothetical protein